MEPIFIPIPRLDGQVFQVDIAAAPVLFILGGNGTGKSALVQRLMKDCRRRTVRPVVYVPGSRPSYFDSDSLQMTANSRSEYEKSTEGYDGHAQMRVRPMNGTAKNERAIYDLQTAELQYRVQAANEIEENGAVSPAIARLQSKASPINRVNRLLMQSNLSIQTVVDNGQIRAVRSGTTFSISNMSDGERTALVLIAEFVAAKPDTIFFVDEPELHMHRSIVLPLISALLAERTDCTTIICTHELSLPVEHPHSPAILVRDCTWLKEEPATWTVELLPNSDSIPDELKIDVLGARQTILFIEGTANSRDLPFYAELFPKLSLRHRSSCNDVRRAVLGLRQTEAFHHVRAFGLVDNDGMTPGFQEQLLAEGTYALPVSAVESLYYSNELISEVARRQGETLGLPPDRLVHAAKDKALATLRQAGKIENLAGIVAERQMRDALVEAFPTRQQMIGAGNAPVTISLPSPYPAILARLRLLVDSGQLEAVISGFPVRKAGVLGDIARELHFLGDADYEKAARAVISTNPGIAQSIRAKLGGLSAQLS